MTLLYAARDEDHNEAVALKAFSQQSSQLNQAGEAHTMIHGLL